MMLILGHGHDKGLAVLAGVRTKAGAWGKSCLGPSSAAFHSSRADLLHLIVAEETTSKTFQHETRHGLVGSRWTKAFSVALQSDVPIVRTETIFFSRAPLSLPPPSLGMSNVAGMICLAHAVPLPRCCSCSGVHMPMASVASKEELRHQLK